jgi:hypothetical protein
LIHKVYAVDPLECPNCGAPMHVIALIDNAIVIPSLLFKLGYSQVSGGKAAKGAESIEDGTKKRGLKRLDDARLYLGLPYSTSHLVSPAADRMRWSVSSRRR